MKNTRIDLARLALVILTGAAAGCSKASAPDPAPPAASATSGSAAASAASAAAPHGEGAAARAPSTWSGTYDAVAGTLFVPDGGEWSGVKFRGEDASTGLGPGTLTLTVDPTGRAEGTGDGALGALLVSGLVDGDTFSANLSPKDPNAGFSGVALGKRDGAGFKGTMHLSYGTASVIREASFTLAKK